MVSGISGFPFIFYLSFALLLLVTAIGKVLKLKKEKIVFLAFYGFLAPLIWFFLDREMYFALTEFVSYTKNGTLIITTKSHLPYWAMFSIPIILTVLMGAIAYKLFFRKKIPCITSPSHSSLYVFGVVCGGCNRREREKERDIKEREKWKE